MPPPLGAGGIMFSGCPSVRPSVRPKPEIPSFDLYMGPLVHPTNRNRFTACPSVRLSVRPSVCPSVRPERFPGICRRMHGGIGLKFLYADVSWPYTELISLWLWSVGFCYFGTILTKWNRSNLGFPGISWGTHKGNGLKYGMLLYPDHLQNWLDYGYCLVIFLILVLFWLSETGQIWGFQAFSGKSIEQMAWYFACWCILTTCRSE